MLFSVFLSRLRLTCHGSSILCPLLPPHTPRISITCRRRLCFTLLQHGLQSDPECYRCVLSPDKVSMGRGCRHRLDLAPFPTRICLSSCRPHLTATLKHTRTAGAEKTPEHSLGVTNSDVRAYVQRQHRQLDGVRCGRLHARM